MTRRPWQPPLPLLAEPLRSDLADRIAPGWIDRAACKGQDTEGFYPEPTRPVEPRTACAGCPVVRSCLITALIGGEWGIWGCTDETERDTIREHLADGTPIALALDGGQPTLWEAA